MPGLPELISLGLLFVMCFISTWMIPVPITAYVMWLGQYDFPWLVVGVATIGTLLGWTTFEPVLARLLKKRPHWADRIPTSYQALFLRQTGLFLFLFNAAPFPIDPIRLLAVVNGYPRERLLIIMGVARLIRNFMLVVLGAVLVRYTLLFWAVLGVFMILPLILGRFFQLSVTGVDKQAVIDELADELRTAGVSQTPQK